MITRHFGIPVTSPGAILRREEISGTPLGHGDGRRLRSGGLVSDKIIIQLIEDWLRLHGGHGFVFDGFPRTLPQAESLEFHVGKACALLGFGDLAGSIGGDCQGPYRGPASMRRMWFYHQLIERTVRQSSRMPLLRRAIGAPQRR